MNVPILSLRKVDRIGKLIDEFHQFARMPRAQRKPSQLNDIIKSVLTLYTGGRVPDSGQDHGGTAVDSEHADLIPKDSTEGIWLENISKIKVETELARIPKLLLDPEQIAQALGNLLKNAIEAMPDGGTLKVTTYFTPITPYGNVEDLQNGDNKAKEDEDTDPNGIVSLEIQDTGCGMSDETLANIFVPYYTTKSDTDGTGLGIPIVRRIVEEHDAEIEFESTEDVGTTVRIYIPYDPNERAEENSLRTRRLNTTHRFDTETGDARSVSRPTRVKPKHTEIGQTKWKLFLIVDDEKNILKMLSQGLEMRGYQTLTAASGEEALQQATKSDIDLVLLDIRMEDGMDGVQTLVKLRERYPELNVVMMSAQQDIEIAVKTMELGAKTVHHKADRH